MKKRISKRILIFGVLFFVGMFFFFGENINAEQPVCETDNGDCYYVSLEGSDSNNGSFEKPFKTMNHALNQAYPGDIVYIRGGEYRLYEGVGGEGTVSFPRGGEPDNPITLKGYLGEDPVLIGSVQLDNWEQYDENIYRTDVSHLEYDVKGLFQDGKRITHPHYFDGKRKHPPISHLDAPGKWTLQNGYIYLWPYNDQDPSNQEIEAPQTRAIDTNGNGYINIKNLTTLYTQVNKYDVGGGINVSGNNVTISNVRVGKNSRGHRNAYAIYCYASHDLTVKNSKIFDSVYWGGHPNSHAFSMVGCGSNGRILLENNVMHNPVGHCVGSKGANEDVIVRNNTLSNCASGVILTGERVNGPGAGESPKGFYEISNNIIKNNNVGVDIKSDSDSNSVYNNVFLNNTRAIRIETEPEHNSVYNNVFLDNEFAYYLAGWDDDPSKPDFYAYHEQDLKTYNNLFWNNSYDYADRQNSWGSPYLAIMDYSQAYSTDHIDIIWYTDDPSLRNTVKGDFNYHWEENSLGEDPLLNDNFYPLASSSVCGAGVDGGHIGIHECSLDNCGDGACKSSEGENCTNCPGDCLGTGEVCCSGTAYTGDCCSDSECNSGYECLDHTCQATQTSEVTINVDSTYPGYSKSVIDDDVVDAHGGTTTTWASTESTTTPHWTEFVFNETKQINNVTIHWAYNNTLDQLMSSQQVTVQAYASSSSSYQDVATITNSTEIASSSASFDAVNTTKLRLWQPADMGPSGYSNIMWLTEVDHGFSSDICGDGICSTAENPNSCPADCSPKGDLNRDGQVGLSDLTTLIGNWMQQQNFGNSDLNKDGRINISDLGLLMSNWGS